MDDGFLRSIQKVVEIESSLLYTKHALVFFSLILNRDHDRILLTS